MCHTHSIPQEWGKWPEVGTGWAAKGTPAQELLPVGISPLPDSASNSFCYCMSGCVCVLLAFGGFTVNASVQVGLATSPTCGFLEVN